jgi:ubiquinone/menaquinone biosynthesis C-methylase UbiE
MSNESFLKSWFEGNSSDEVIKKKIAANWDDKTLKRHLEIINVPKGINSVIEIGAGVGRILKELKDIELRVGIEASEDMIRFGKEYCKGTDIQLIKVSGEGNVPVPSNQFDFAFSLTVFQHIPSTLTVKKYIGEMYRCLRKGGKMRIQILANDEFPGNKFWSYHRPQGLMNYMISLGFTDVKKEDYARWSVLEGIK